MDDPNPTDLQTLRDIVADLQARVAQLERSQSSPANLAPGEVDTALIQRLQERRGPDFDNGTLQGALVYATSAVTGAGPIMWYAERSVPHTIDAISAEIEPFSQLLSALGHPTRLALVLTLLQHGASTTQALQEAVGAASVGQFYHHMKELTQAGVVSQPRRSVYEINIKLMGALLTLLTASAELAQSPHHADEEPDS